MLTGQFKAKVEVPGGEVVEMGFESYNKKATVEKIRQDILNACPAGSKIISVEKVMTPKETEQALQIKRDEELKKSSPTPGTIDVLANPDAHDNPRAYFKENPLPESERPIEVKGQPGQEQ